MVQAINNLLSINYDAEHEKNKISMNKYEQVW